MEIYLRTFILHVITSENVIVYRGREEDWSRLSSLLPPEAAYVLLVATLGFISEPSKETTNFHDRYTLE